MRKTTTYLLFTLFISTMLWSCGNRKHEKGEKDKLPRVSDKDLEAALFDQADIPFNFMNVRVGVDFYSTQRKADFSCYVKLDVDSAFGGTIKVAGIIFAAYKVTPDSVIFVNKYEDCYFAEELAYISNLFGTDISFDFFQEMIVGRPIALNSDTKYQQIDSEDDYILSSHKKRAYKKLENDRLKIEEDVMLIQYHLAPETFKLTQIDVDIPSDTTAISVQYKERKLEEGHDMPEITEIYITSPKDSIHIELNYGAIRLNDPKSIRIKIPDSYIECP